MTEDRSVYIRHIYDCIGWIKEYVQAGKEDFFQDRKPKTPLSTTSKSSAKPSTTWEPTA